MTDVAAEVERLATQTGFSGVVRVDVGGRTEVVRAFGMADRRWGVTNTLDTRFAIASGTKAFTALTVMRLVQDNLLRLDTPARELLGDDLPLIDDSVTVEQLLAHRSGIGDYLDEEAGGEIDDYVLPVPVHRLATAEDYLAVLDGYPQVFPPGARFAYCNGGYVVLALIAERATGVPYHDLVTSIVCEPAGLDDTSFVRSDELPPGTAVGYLRAHGHRTNVLHLPVLGVGDGGVYSTVADVHTLWSALFAGRIVSSAQAREMVRPRSDAPENRVRYGLGFWLGATGDRVILEGFDAGVSFRSVHDPSQRYTHTMISNTSDDPWALARMLDARFSSGPPAT